MHLKKYYFIDKFNPGHIKKLDNNISLVYRKYNSLININLIMKIRNFCKIDRRNFYLANNIKLALKLNLDGVYFPSFNKDLKHLNYIIPKKFIIIGSAHNLKEIRNKEKQNVSQIFISSIFKKNKNYLGFYKFIKLSKITNKNVIALGGINNKNLKMIHLLNIKGYAAINLFKNSA